MDILSVTDEDRLSPGEADYLLVLTELVEAYEDAQFPVASAFGDGIDALNYLVEQSGMSASDLGRLLGNRQLGSAILRRERELSKSHIVKLADHFRVSTDLFMLSKAKSRPRIIDTAVRKSYLLQMKTGKGPTSISTPLPACVHSTFFDSPAVSGV